MLDRHAWKSMWRYCYLSCCCAFQHFRAIHSAGQDEQSVVHLLYFAERFLMCLDSLHLGRRIWL